MAFVLVHAVQYAGATTAPQERRRGILQHGSGFVLTIGLASCGYELKPLKLVAISTGYQLVGLLAMGAIVAVWTLAVRPTAGWLSRD